VQVFVRIIRALGGELPAGGAGGSAGGAQAVDQLPEVAALRRIITQPAPTTRKRKLSGDAPPPSDDDAEGGVWALILLDEMDALLSRAQGVLYELFALPTLQGARCVLVGAANTMNLTDRLLPRLRARDCEPALASFPAYTVSQLGELLRARLAPLPWRVFEEGALDLCARRVAAASGDMRRALHAACAAVDVARAEAAVATGAAADEDEDAAPAAAAGALVRTAHMARALSQSFKLPVVETIRALPRHHQLTLCTAVLLFRGGERKDATLGELNDAYTDLCRRNSLKGLSAVDFSSVCSALADDALITCSNRLREERKRRIALCVHEDDIVFALQGTHLFVRLLAE
jgi:cell division control protein 6